MVRSQVEHHRATGDPLAEGVATTAEGVPTTDAADTQFLVPTGGYKGFGLASMVEVLSCVMTGMKWGVIRTNVPRLWTSFKMIRNFRAGRTRRSRCTGRSRT